MIKAGELAVLKTTGEIVYVLSEDADSVRVRRATIVGNGIQHLVEEFTPGELESFTETVQDIPIPKKLN